MSITTFPFVPVDKDAYYKLPERGAPGDACFDLYAAEEIFVPLGESYKLRTNLRVLLPPGWELQFRSRSSAGKTGIRVYQGIGTIDQRYTGPLFIIVESVLPVGKQKGEYQGHEIQIGDRVAQGKFARVEPAEVVLATEEDYKEHVAKYGDRGGSYGSTGR